MLVLGCVGALLALVYLGWTGGGASGGLLPAGGRTGEAVPLASLGQPGATERATSHATRRAVDGDEEETGLRSTSLARVELTVVRSEDRSPIERYRVSCFDDAVGWSTAGVSDAAGLVVFDGLAGTSATFRGERGGELPLAWEPGSTSRAVLEVRAGIRLTVDVRDAQGLPVPGASVFLGPDRGMYEPTCVGTTDAAGRLALTDVEEGLAVVVHKAGYGLSFSYPVFSRLLEEGVLPVDLLQAGSALRCVVTDAHGRPVQGALVHARAAALPRSDHRPPFKNMVLTGGALAARSDVRGVVLLESLAGSTQYAGSVLAPGYAAQEARVWIDAGEAKTLEVALPEGFTLEVRPRDESGGLLEGFLVTLTGMGRTRAVGARGNYRFEGVARGTYGLRVKTSLGHLGEASVTLDGDEVVELRCGREGVVEVRFRSEGSESRRVFVYAPPERPGFPLRHLGLVENDATLFVRPAELGPRPRIGLSLVSGVGWNACAEVAVEPGASTLEVVLSDELLQVGWILMGLAASDANAAGARARIGREDAGSAEEYELKQGETSRIGPLAPGVYRVELIRSKGAEPALWGHCMVPAGEDVFVGLVEL